MRWVLIIPLCFAGCDTVSERFGNGGGAAEIVVEPEVPEVVEPEGVQPLPDTSAGPLGRTVASLGNAAEPGLWLKTPLVAVEGPGRVSDPQSGRSVSVSLIPIAGSNSAGSRLSLQAMQTLGLNLTDLVEVEVIAGG